MFFIILSAFSIRQAVEKFRGVFNRPYAIFHTKYGIRRMNHSTQGASRPVAAAQVDEIAAAIVSPRGRGRGGAFISSLRLFRPVAHRLHAARIDAEADQEIPDRARASVAEAEIVLRRAARATVALEIEPIGQGSQLVLLRLKQVGFVVVEKDRPGSFLELLGGRRFPRRRRRGGDRRRRRRRFGDRDARAGGGGTAVAQSRRGVSGRGARADFPLAGTRHFAQAGDGQNLGVLRGPAQLGALAKFERRLIGRQVDLRLRRLDYGDRDRGAVAGRLLAALGHDLEFSRVGRTHALAADLVDLLAVERDILPTRLNSRS